MSRIDDAIRFAADKHKGAVRKGNGQPYIFHPLEVLSLVSMMTKDEDVLCAAILHDTVEDTDTKIDDIVEKFGDRVAKLVDDETEEKMKAYHKDETWKVRKEYAIEHIRNLEDEGAKMVCLADKLSNLRSMHMLMMVEGDKAWDNFNMKDPKQHYWYYRSLADALSSLEDTAVYKEYVFMIEATFNKYLGD